MKKFLLTVTLLTLTCMSLARESETPARTILFIIDGLHWQGPEKLNITNFNSLRKQGTYIKKACLLMPYHPTTGDWAQMHNSSMPNPIMLSGSLFIKPGHRLIQEMFPREFLTAHSTNSTAYISINRGCDISFIQDTSDDKAIDFAVDALKKYDIRYMRIHLQDTGTGGWNCSNEKQDVPWKKNIWGEGSPYIKNALNADKLLGDFVQQLKAMNKLNDTLLIVTADHGQAVTGWHPTLDKDSWYTPLLFTGPGIAKDRQLEYAEHIDIVPTICSLMQIEQPTETASGRTLHEIIETTNHIPNQYDPKRLTERLNCQLKDYAKITSKLLLAAEKDPYLENIYLITSRNFYHLDSFPEWYKAGSIEQILETNKLLLEEMSLALENSHAAHYISIPDDTFAMFPENGQIAFENRLIAFRSYSDGWGFDIFGKTINGKRLTLKNFFKIEPPFIKDYHKLNNIGMDILHLGQTPGLGGVMFVIDGREYIPKFKQSHWQIITSGRQNCCVKASAPLTVNGKELTAQRVLMLSDSSRFIEDTVELVADRQVLTKTLIAVGLTQFEKNKVLLDERNGWMISYGGHEVEDVKEIGLTLKFHPESFVKQIQKQGGVYTLLKPQIYGNIAISKQSLTAYWDKDHSIKNVEEMKNAIRTGNN